VGGIVVLILSSGINEVWKDLRRIFHTYPQKEALGQKIDRGVERIK
jgi:hypothetical protein